MNDPALLPEYPCPCGGCFVRNPVADDDSTWPKIWTCDSCDRYMSVAQARAYDAELRKRMPPLPS